MAPRANKLLQLVPVGICMAYVGYVAQDRFADHENERSLKLVRLRVTKCESVKPQGAVLDK